MAENNKQTLVAFIRLACTLVATGGTMFGIAIDADSLFIIAGLFVSLAAAVWSWWKNNNVTAAATEAQDFYALFKANNEDMRNEEDTEEVEG